jgi:hypothetical protein
MKIARMLAALAACGWLMATPARAVPSFAMQTGQACVACHIGAYGPQLTPYGRAFKLGGYTSTGGEGWTASLPASVMLLGSFTHTSKGQPGGASEHYGNNNNFAMDQISVFLAGRVNDHVGGFIQGTFDGIASQSSLDNTDLRATDSYDIGTHELRLGLDVNNGPTVQDPYNSTYAWGYPFVASALAPTPAAAPLITGGLIGNSIGTTVYAQWDRSLYLEVGLYNTYGPALLSITGQGYGPGSTAQPAPYLRAAYEWNWSAQSAHVGGMFLHSNFNPATGLRTADGSAGRDSYTDYAVDGGYQYLGDGTHVVSAFAILAHEDSNLVGTTNAGGSSQNHNSLNDLRASISYYYRQTYGVTVAWQDTWGKANPALFAPDPIGGSANGKPNSSAYIVEVDWVPFGKEGAWGGPWANLKLGAQYTGYTRFNGGVKNYDGNGRNASDNNTLYMFAWLIF